MPRSPPSSSQSTLTPSTSASGLLPEPPHSSNVTEPLKVTSTLHEETSDGEEEDEEDDEKVLETSSDGRWQKINHHVRQLVTVLLNTVEPFLFYSLLKCTGR